MSQIKRTPLCEEHIRLGGKMVDFAGWFMPVQYKGIKEEHHNVRKHVGLFDVSHMGEVRVQGPKALETLEWLTTNDVSRLENGEAQYSLLPNTEGGLVDDIIVYCLEKNNDYLVCVNASNTDKDFTWMKAHNKGATLTNESDKWAQIAVQGPQAFALLEKVFKYKVSEQKSFTLVNRDYQGQTCMVATTGYTGEKGAEIFVPVSVAVSLWQELLKQGEEFNTMPIGLGARDTLRLEMKYSLYGHEIDDHSNPYAAGLGWVIKPAKKDFIGKHKILAEKEKGLTQQLVGIQLLEKGIPRQGYNLFSFDNKEIGKVTSGTLSPTTDEPIGIAYINKEYAQVGSEIFVDIRGRKVKAQVVPTPFVKK